MFDLVFVLSFLAHFAALGGLAYAFLKKKGVPHKETPFFVLLLLWGALVLAGHGASAFGCLNKLEVYVPMTFVGIGLMLFFFQSVWRQTPATPLLRAPLLSFTPVENPKTRKFLFWFLALTLGLFALVSIVLGLSVYPDNADSMIYRLPRAFWYVSSGSFLHPFASMDNRLVYYPLDGVALYIPFVLYGLPGTIHAVPSLLSWGMIAYTAYRFARELGADRLLSLFACWLVGLTPSILAQATSTNDEILAAAALLGCLYMGWRWLVTGRHAYFFMAGFALSLSAGTKLHIVFLLPIIVLGCLIVLWKMRKNLGQIKVWGKIVGWQTGIETALLMFIMFAPFLFYNYASVGRFYFFNDFKGDVFNLSASLRVGLQNLLIYVSQMTLSPIADLNFWPIANDRQAFNTGLNNIFNPFIRPLLDNDPTHYHLGYRFVGITIPVSVRFVEFSLWSAFIWLLWPIQARLALAQKQHPLRLGFFLLAITPPAWLLLWSFSTLYMEGTATYFTFYLVCAAPAAILTFLPIRRPIWNEIRWVVIALVTLSNLVICHNLVMYSGFRALPDLYYARTWPYDWLLTEKKIIHEIRASSRTRIVFTHEKMPYFGYMHWNPRATYYSPFEIKDPKDIPDLQNVLQILPISGLNMYGFMPLKIPGKLTPGPTYLGTVRAIGREAIFATGAGVEKRYPADSDYLLTQAKIEPSENGQWTVTMSPEPLGYSPDDQLTFEYIVRSGDQELYRREPKKEPGFRMVFKASPHEYVMTMTIIVRSSWSGKEVARSTYALGGGGYWLPEGSEY